MLSLLRRPAFRLLFLGRSLTLVGDAVIPAALALAVLRATGSASALALVLGCAMVPRLLLLPVGGVLADRFSARTVVLTTDLIRAAAQLLVGMQLLSGEPSLALIAAAQVAGGAASAFAMPAMAPLVTGTVEEAERQRANALLGTVESTTRLGGPALAGLLIWLAGPGWAFVLDAATFALSAACLARLRVPHVPLPRRSLRADLVEGWSEVRSRDWYWTALVAHAVWNFAASVLVVLGPALAVREQGGEGMWIAFLQAGSVGVLLGSLLAGRIRLRRPVMVANAGLTTYALPLTLLALAAPAPVTIAAYGVAMAGLGFLNPVWQTAVQNAVPARALARVTSYDWLVSLGAMPLGYLLAPLAAAAWGPDTPLLACAALVAVVCAGTAAVPGVRRFGADADAERDASPVTGRQAGREDVARIRR
ncbi:MFS transporter [Streptomyces sp. DSM 42041]|uniref:MFS transporter n=1 Tax=Streptomyces hazeniae TaxID=3075538 RepID=A0ABU2NU13_9ACTN|nr:MFS transporter [Streptomyces sp. DSM 42041]MDT0380472.1 MFS transporter [Streptomyces sp. DSM 42041]